MSDPVPQPEAIDPNELEIRSILLLDDDPELAETLRRLLESHNFMVTAVSDGLDGLREVMETDFDVILCDMMMPQMPGDMFYLAVQKTKPHLCRRFVFITGESGNPKVAKFLDDVNGLVLLKPAGNDELINMISLACKRGRENSTAEK